MSALKFKIYLTNNGLVTSVAEVWEQLDETGFAVVLVVVRMYRDSCGRVKSHLLPKLTFSLDIGV